MSAQAQEVEIPFPGVLVGHHTDAASRTGCTVVLLPAGTIGSGEVRGGAPATREFALLEPTRTVQQVDAVVLSGGSAFGLAACDGVVEHCVAQGRGFDTAFGRVPIVVGMSLFDLGQGDASVRPTAADGRAAAARATGATPVGQVGAGTGATVGKWRGADAVRPGGLGAAVVRRDDLAVLALVAVNAVGDIDDGTVRAAIAAGTFGWPAPAERFAGTVDPPDAGTNTTIGLLVTNAVLDKVGCRLLAESGHDGLARALFPAHARSDGDALVAVSLPPREDEPARPPAPDELDVARLLGAVAVELAVRSLA